MEPGLRRDALTLLLGLVTGVLSALFGIGGAIVSNPGPRALGAAPLVAVGTTRRPRARPGVGDNREHPTPRSATLPLRGTSHGEGGSRAPTPAGGGAADPAGGGAADPPVTGDPAPTAARRVRWRAAGIGVAAGLLSGLLGIGGGVIMVPAFTELLGLSLKSAIATSLVCVGIFGVPATVAHALLGDIDWRLAVLLTVAAVPGARIGASLTIRTAEHRLRLAVGVFLALVALVYLVSETRALFEEL